MQPVIIIHHHEIILKGDNRQFFERRLQQNIQLALAGILPPDAVRGGYGKFFIFFEDNGKIPIITERITKVFGIANICFGMKIEQDVDEMCRTAEMLLKDLQFKTIRVDARRPDKNFPVRSMEINSKVGAHICHVFGVRANLTSPDATVYIEVVDGFAYVYCSKIEGAKGLPSGVSGRVVALLSAGFDSPVAAWQIMKRGAHCVFVHFHSLPYTSQQSIEQVRQLVNVLTQFQFSSKLLFIPFADIQQEIVLKTPPPFRVLMYRRMMVRIAEAIAQREKAEALITGEAVGQVASQTLRNIHVIDDAATLPILRPLSGADKEETMAFARRIGTFEISNEPYDDCCSFLAPRSPSTWATLSEIHEAEAKLDVPLLIQKGLGAAETEMFYYPVPKAEVVSAETA